MNKKIMNHKMMARKNETINATTGQLLTRFFQKIERTAHQEPHPGLMIASHNFFEPYPLVNEIVLLSLATMDLLNKFAYPSLSGYGKFTITFTMMRSYGEEISFTLGQAIPLTYMDGKLIPKSDVYAHISRYIMKYAEVYDGDYIVRLMIRVYMDSKKKEEERYNTLSSIIEGELSKIEEPITARKIKHGKHSRYPTHITALKPRRTELKAFIVADTETIYLDNIHKPYAAGLMMVCPGDKINKIMINYYFSEDYSIILDSFEERSTKVLYDFVLRILSIVRKEKSTFTIYFHNFSRFDGILLLKHLAYHHKSLKLKPLMRNHRLYELAVYSGKKMLFRFRDSLNLLPGKLSSLGKNLCPDLGPKGSISIPYDELKVEDLINNRRELLDYMKQDIRLLGGVMQKAQEIYWELYQVDIESKITLPSLALSIFRLKYYDVSNFPIHIPNKNEDTFIRRAYYGGHTDTYKPYGEDLYYYDVNSLYPFVMKEFPMPGGEPVWHSNLESKDLDSMFGFIEAYVVCPKTIKKPFLPYRDKNNTLLFPTGEFVGVYYTEELKYARGLGYMVLPISGYLFKRMESPFRSFVSSLFESRLDARKSGNEAMAYVYKILMNSLYGRFGINPKSTTTEVCDEYRYKDLIRNSELIFGDMLCENKYIVAYHSNTEKGLDYWNPPKNSTVQLAAAITASARIHMYPYISREDCYYTDTDSVVLGHPLPNEEISSVLGKFKLEDRIIKGYFLAPKAYFYISTEGKNVLKYKGPAKNLIMPEWFEAQYKDPSRTELVSIESKFRIDWHTLNIFKKDSQVRLGIKLGNKRIPVHDKDVWVDTEPIHINDLSFLDHIGKEIIKSLRYELIQLQIENQTLNEKLNQKESEISERYKEIKSQLDAKNNTEEKALTEPPMLLLPEGQRVLEVIEDSREKERPPP
nr:DNA polymerase-like [Ipomoea batatas]